MMINKKTTSILFMIISIILLTVINYYSLMKSQSTNNENIVARLKSLSYSVEISGKDLRNITLGNYSNTIKDNFQLAKGFYLILVLSTSGCNLCIWQELEKMNKFSNLVSKYSTIKYIYYGDNLINVLRYKKFLNSIDTIFYSLDKQLESLNKSFQFPYLLLIKDGIVSDSHFPIPNDTTFSNLFYERMKSKIMLEH
ncbi:MAG: hypothetical protein KGZ42_09220 [Melioribacter sp.]|nr:hypothetical protein [Melioribacter sp.]